MKEESIEKQLWKATDKAENVFFVPPAAKWSFLLSNAKLPNIGKIVDEAMDVIEKENNSLKGVLPKVYARDNLDSKSLGGLIDLIEQMEEKKALNQKINENLAKVVCE